MAKAQNTDRLTIKKSTKQPTMPALHDACRRHNLMVPSLACLSVQ